MIGATSSMYSVIQRPSPQELFAKMDTDGSEGLSADEIEGTKLSEAVGDDFSGVDTDGSGELSHDELKALSVSLEGEASGNGGKTGDRPPPPPPPSEGGGGLQMSLLTALMELDSEDSEDASSFDVLSTVSGSSEIEDASTTEFTSSEEIASSLLDDALASAEEDAEEEDLATSLIDDILLDEEAA